MIVSNMYKSRQHPLINKVYRTIEKSAKTMYPVGMMINRRIFFVCILMCIASLPCFGQASAIRDYVGMISQSFHPDIVSYMEQFRDRLQRRGYTNAARSIDHFLKGESGTGFLYVAPGGTNYIITNYHVISQAHTLSVTFEKVDGERTRFSDLTIVAADEEMDIALLTFAGGQNPFRQGLAFLNRPVQEGDDVYSAGFPGLGTSMVWQLGRGMVSNASVRLPNEDEPGKFFGPFIQHTAQVDPGNSGGPLLVQTQGVPTGFAVAGINTLSARFRQAANFSIPTSRVQAFLTANLGAAPKTDSTGLEERVTSFIEGLGVPKAVYPHIADYLSNTCTAENAEFAISETFSRASRTVQNDIAETFVNSPVDGMAYAVAWTIENALRSKTGKITIVKDSIVAADDNKYTVNFIVNDKPMKSEWINEYGIWRIRTFGDFAAGDKTFAEKRKKEEVDAARLRAEPSAQIDGGFAWIFDRGPAFGADFIFRADWFGFGARTFIGLNFFQVDVLTGFYFPIKAQTVAFTPFVNASIGLQFRDTGSDEIGGIKFPDLGVSFQGGLQFTTAAVSGLYFQAAYQFNLFLLGTLASEATQGEVRPDRHVIFFGVGYSFK